MRVCVTLLKGEDATKPAVVLSVGSASDCAVLQHVVHLGGGVRLLLDLSMPRAWRQLSISSWSVHVDPLLNAMIGPQAVADLRSHMEQWTGECQETGEIEADLSSADPWIRLALTEALDRWLQLPVEQALLDAERAVARFYAGLSLPDGTDLRQSVIGESLGLARRVSAGVRRFLTRLSRQTRPLPEAFHDSLEHLVRGYDSMAEHVAHRMAEHDQELSGVGKTWQAVLPHLQVGGELEVAEGRRAPRLTSQLLHPGGRVAGMVDPRHVRARVFAQNDDPTRGEITLSSPDANMRDAVVIKVPAFARRIDPEIVQRLMVRLVNRSDGAAHGFGQLTVSTIRSKDGRPYFECTMPVGERALEDLQADVYDVLSAPSSAAEGTVAELYDVRRAVLRLADWRGRAARAALRPDVVAAVHSTTAGRASHLQSSTNGTRSREQFLDESPRASADSWLAQAYGVEGAAKPLVAELAAAHEGLIAGSDALVVPRRDH